MSPNHSMWPPWVLFDPKTRERLFRPEQIKAEKEPVVALTVQNGPLYRLKIGAGRDLEDVPVPPEGVSRFGETEETRTLMPRILESLKLGAVHKEGENVLWLIIPKQ